MADKEKYQAKKLNHHHKLFCQELMTGKTQKDAYLTAYPKSSENSAIVNGSRLLTYDSIKKECIRIMERKTGLRVCDMLDKLQDLTIADKQIVLDHQLKSVSDNPTRLEALKTGFKLMGLMDNRDINIDNRSINVELNTEDIDKLSDITKSLQQLRLRQDKISGLISG